MKPITRKEMLMAKAAGQTVPDLEPITREEYFLNQIAESGGGGGGLPTIEEGDEGKVLTVDEGAAVWAEGGGGSSDPYAGYDWVIQHDSLDFTTSPSEYHVVKGDYNTLCALGNQNLPIKLLFYSTSGNDLHHTVRTITQSTVFYTDYDDYGDDVPFIQAIVYDLNYVPIIKYTSSGLSIEFD